MFRPPHSPSQAIEKSLRVLAQDDKTIPSDLIKDLQRAEEMLIGQEAQASLTSNQRFVLLISSYNVLVLRGKTDDAHRALLTSADLNAKIAEPRIKTRNEFELAVLARLDPRPDSLPDDFKAKFFTRKPIWVGVDEQLPNGSTDWALQEISPLLDELERQNAVPIGRAVSIFRNLIGSLATAYRQPASLTPQTYLDFVAASSVLLAYERSILLMNQRIMEFRGETDDEPFANRLEALKVALPLLTPFARRQFLEEYFLVADNVIALDDPMGAVGVMEIVQEIASAHPAYLNEFQKRIDQYAVQMPYLGRMRKSLERLNAGQVQPASVLLMDELPRIQTIADQVAREEVLGLYHRSRARVALVSGDFNAAEADYLKSLAILTRLDRLGAIGAWGELAQARAAAGNYKQALADIESGFALDKKQRDKYPAVFVDEQAATLHVVSVVVYYLTGDDIKMKAALDRSLAIYEPLKNAVSANPQTLAMLYTHRGILLAKGTDCFVPLIDFKSTLEIIGEAPTPLAEVVYLEMGKCYEKEDQFPKAIESYEKALLVNRHVRKAARGSAAYDLLLGRSPFDEIQGELHRALYDMLEQHGFTSTVAAQELFYNTELAKSRATVDEIESMRQGIVFVNPAMLGQEPGMLGGVMGELLGSSRSNSSKAQDTFAKEEEFLCQLSERHHREAVMLQYVPIEKRDRVIFFVISQSSSTWLLLPTPWSQIKKDVGVFRDAIKESLAEYAELRKSPRPDPVVIARIKQLEVEIDQTSNALAKMLLPSDVPAIGTLGKYLEGKSVILVPHGELHNLPFVALPMSAAAGKRRYLIDVVGRLTTVPSRTVLHSVVSLYKSNLEQRVSSVLLVGDAESADLPAVQGEFEGIKQAIGRTTTASERKDLVPLVRNSPAVHFAGHAYFNHANLGHSGLSLKDGTWTLAEITRISAKRTRLVTMGACESGESGLLPGDEVWGLANGFLFAGIPAVVGSLWNQDDEAARIFFSTFYSRMRNRQDVGAAFRTAMLDVRDSREMAEGITDQPGLMGSSNPCFWAGFNFIGE